MAIKKLILHLGLPKTGTTSIQATCKKNLSILEKQGVRYMIEWKRGDMRGGHITHLNTLFADWEVPSYCHHPAFQCTDILNAIEREEEQSNLTETVKKIVNTIDCDSLLISGEWTGFCIEKCVENLKQWLYRNFNNVEVEILVFVRNPISFVVSFFQQDEKTGYKRLDSNYLDIYEVYKEQYLNTIKNLYRYFPTEFKLIKFEDAVSFKDGGLVGYFLQEIGIINRSSIEIIRGNDGTSYEALELLRFINLCEPVVVNKLNNPKRLPQDGRLDARHLFRVRGVKYDLPIEGKLELRRRWEDVFLYLKENFGIDYSNCAIEDKVPLPSDFYSDVTIDDFIEVFPELTPILQKLFLEFFELKYRQTAQEKFKRLFFKGSVPFEIYHKNCEAELARTRCFPKFLINFVCCFVPRKKNRDRLRYKYIKR